MINLFEKIAPKLAFVIALVPGLAAALTNGPGMPEYNEFEPVDATDMVDLHTGDFNYTLPLGSVPGPGLDFPIVLSYHSGIMPQQEASWVGLGWNLQAGAIARTVSKVPDDYKGSPVVETIESDKIHGWWLYMTYMGVSVGISHDDLIGYGGMMGIGMSVGIKNTPFNYGGSVTGGANGVWDGISLTGSVGVSSGKEDGLNAGLGLSATLNTNNGMTYGSGVGISYASKDKKTKEVSSYSLASVGASIGSGSAHIGGSVGGTSFSQSTSVTGSLHTDQNSFGLDVGVVGFGFGTYTNWVSGEQTNSYYGFLYGDRHGMDCLGNNSDGTADCTRKTGGIERKQEFQAFSEPFIDGLNDFSHARMMASASDQYRVSAQGLSGSFKPYRKEDGDYMDVLTVSTQAKFAELCFFTGYWCGDDVYERTTQLEKYRNFLNANNRSDVYWRFMDDQGGAEYSSPGVADRDANPLVSVQSKKIRPIFASGILDGFEITKQDGVRYVYNFPVYNLWEQKKGIETGKVNNRTTQTWQTKYAYAWLLTAVLSPDYIDLNDNGVTSDDVGGWVKFRYGKGERDADGNPIFDGKTPYVWRSPYYNPAVVSDASNADAVKAYAPNSFGQAKFDYPGGYVTGRNAALGWKEIAYLAEVETPTHKAEFSLSDRLDGRPFADFPFFPLAVSGYTAIINSDKTMTITIKNGPLPSASEIVMKSDDAVDVTVNYLWVAGGLPRMGSKRLNGKSVNNSFLVVDGDISPSASNLTITSVLVSPSEGKLSHMKRLDAIVVRNKRVAGAPATWAAKFAYDYSLTPNTPNSDAVGAGKLSLQSVTVGATEQGPWLAPYRFRYGTNPSYQSSNTRPNYELHEWDRWGYRSGYSGADADVRHNALGNAANAWNLSDIHMPSGGRIHVEFEADRFSLVGARCDINTRCKYVDGQFQCSATNGCDAGTEFNVVNFVNQQTGEGNLPESRILMNSSKGYDMGWINPGPIFTKSLDLRIPTKMANLSVEHLGFGASNFLRYEIEVKANVNGEAVAKRAADDFFLEPVPTAANYWSGVGTFGIDGDGQLDEIDVRFNCVYHKNYPVNMQYRIFAVYRTPPQHVNKAVEIPGGGVRVTSVTMFEPLSGRENTIQYEYQSGLVASLPPTYSEFSDQRYPLNIGYEYYTGSSEVVYPKVIVRPLSVTNARTEYRFLTVADIPVQFKEETLTGTTGYPAGQTMYRIAVTDMSALWGQVLSVQEYFSTLLVRETKSEWAYNESVAQLWQNLSNPLLQPVKTFLRDIPKKSGEYDVFIPAYAGVVSTQSPTDTKYFGTQQTLSSYRYAWGRCRHDDCNQDQMAVSQTMHKRILPYQVSLSKKQDGALRETNFYNYDYLTGDPLNTMESNVDKQGGVEARLSARVPATHKYMPMAVRNQLTQPHLDVAYHYPVGAIYPTYTDPLSLKTTPLSDGNLFGQGPTEKARIVSASMTIWRPYGIQGKLFRDETPELSIEKWANRMYESWDWRNKKTTGASAVFSPIFDGCATIITPQLQCADETTIGTNNPNWIGGGSMLRYGPYGYPTLFRDTRGVYAASITGHGSSLVTATIANAAPTGNFYESFEDAGDLIGKFYQPYVIGTHYNVLSPHAKTGGNSLLVKNSSETSMICFNVGNLEAGKSYEASAWYFDKTASTGPADANATRPGIFVGQNAGCAMENHPNGVSHGPESQPGDANYSSRATGSGRWVKISAAIRKGQCRDASKLTNSILCVYASKGNTGLAVSYDEVRLHAGEGLMYTYAYDTKGNMVSSSDPNGTVFDYEYDKFGNLSGIRNDDGELVSESAKKIGAH